MTEAAAKAILFVCPTRWDEAELPRVMATGPYRIVPFGTDVSEHPERFDALDFIEGAVAAGKAMAIDGVMASDDYPGSIVAPVIARRLDVCGPDPQSVLLCHHKYYSRIAQRAISPEAVPSFALLDPETVRKSAAALRFPVFVKPVKSFFSLLAQEVGSLEELVALAQQADHHLREFVKPFNQLLKRYGSFPLDGGYLLAEQPIRGRQITVEGCMFRGEGSIIGVTDSIMYSGTICFRRFDYPSSLQSDVQERMCDLALRFMRSIRFDNGLFNVEMFYDAEGDAIHIIEVNPRMCPQFADLMEKVNGVNTYEVALSIASGVRPTIHGPSPQYRVATSFVLRVFEDKIVARVPSRVELAVFQARFPDARLKVMCRENQHLSDELQDGKSYRYAVLNLGGQSARDLADRYAEAMRYLRFEFASARKSLPTQIARRGRGEQS
jgi:ATP-grasp domain